MNIWSTEKVRADDRHSRDDHEWKLIWIYKTKFHFCFRSEHPKNVRNSYEYLKRLMAFRVNGLRGGFAVGHGADGSSCEKSDTSTSVRIVTIVTFITRTETRWSTRSEYADGTSERNFFIVLSTEYLKTILTLGSNTRMELEGGQKQLIFGLWWKPPKRREMADEEKFTEWSWQGSGKGTATMRFRSDLFICFRFSFNQNFSNGRNSSRIFPFVQSTSWPSRTFCSASLPPLMTDLSPVPDVLLYSACRILLQDTSIRFHTWFHLGSTLPGIPLFSDVFKLHNE